MSRKIQQYTRAELREITFKRWKERRKSMSCVNEADNLLKKERKLK